MPTTYKFLYSWLISFCPFGTVLQLKNYLGFFQGKNKRYIDRTRCAKKLNSWRRRVPKKTVFVVVPDFPHIIHTLDSLHFRHNMATPLDFTKSQTYLGPKGMPGLCTMIIVVLVKKWFLFCYIFRLSLYGCYKVFVEFRFWTVFESETYLEKYLLLLIWRLIVVSLTTISRAIIILSIKVYEVL